MQRSASARSWSLHSAYSESVLFAIINQIGFDAEHSKENDSSMQFEKPQFLQGVYSFEGRGLTNPFSLSSELSYTVPAGKRGQMVYFRGGNSSAELIYAVLMRDGQPMRYFPMGARSDVHVPLAVVEDLLPSTKIEVYLAAPEHVSGSVVFDIGLVEI